MLARYSRAGHVVVTPKPIDWERLINVDLAHGPLALIGRGFDRRRKEVVEHHNRLKDGQIPVTCADEPGDFGP